MVSHPQNGSDSPIGSDRDRGRDKSFWLDALNLKWLGVIGGPPLHGF